jgi:hypothetical protein
MNLNEDKQMPMFKLRWVYKEHPNAALCRYFKTEEELIAFKQQYPHYNYEKVS